MIQYYIAAVICKILSKHKNKNGVFTFFCFFFSRTKTIRFIDKEKKEGTQKHQCMLVDFVFDFFFFCLKIKQIVTQ